MRQGNPNKRLRGRNGGGGNNNNNRKGPNPLTRTYESNGPDVKIRGTVLHIAEKYVQLARDAQAIGDTVMGENYLQHAEHYYRIIAAANANSPNPVFIRTEEDMQAEDDYEAAPRAEPRFEAGRGDGGRNEGGRGEGGRGDGNRGGDAPYQRPVRGSRHERVVFNNGDPTVPAVLGLGPQPVVSVPRFVPEAVVPAASAAAAPVSAPVPEAPVAAPEAAVEAVAEPVTAEPEEAPARRPRARVARTPRRAPAAAPEEAVEIEAPEAAPEEAAAGDEAPRPRRRVRGSRGRGRRAEAGAAEASAGEDALPVATE